LLFVLLGACNATPERALPDAATPRLDGGDADAQAQSDAAVNGPADAGGDAGEACGAAGCTLCSAPTDCSSGVCAEGVCAEHFAITGRVFEAPSGTLLSNAVIVAADGSQTTSDADGEFALTVAATTKRLTVSATGFTTTLAPVDGSFGVTKLEVLLKKPTLTRTVLPDQPFVVEGNGVRLSGPANAFVDEHGMSPTGAVELVVTLTSLTDPLDGRAAPRGFHAINPDGEEVPAPRMIMADISARAGGVELTVAAGAQLIVDIPIDVDNAALEAGLYSLDEAAGLWRPEGTAMRTLDSEGRPVYRMRLTHLSWWSSWWSTNWPELDFVCVQGKITRSGKRVDAFLGAWSRVHDYWTYLPADATGYISTELAMDYSNTLWAEDPITWDQSSSIKRDYPNSGCVQIGELKLPAHTASSCPRGTKLCGSTCKSVTSDVKNCGACGTACGSGQSCVAGACVCPEGDTVCGGTCRDTQADRNHCGGCGVMCKTYEECVTGSCVETPCPGGMERCGAECIDVQGDNERHCGACDEACEEGDYCAAGSCVVVSVCGDSVVEAGEVTEVCDDGVNDGGYGSCTADCLDFGPHCGDGIVQTDEGETCEAGVLECPASCDDGDVCTADTRSGSSAACNVVCSHGEITAAENGDDCCPSGVYADTDDDCEPACGNAVKEPGEACDDGTNDGHYGIGSCEPGCTALAAYCGDGTVQDTHGEVCDSASADTPCPASCDDEDSCTVDTQMGSAAACTISCTHDAISATADGDGCCPDGADATSDDDCPPVCGNSVREGAEVCDLGVNVGSYDGCMPGCAALGPHCGDGITQFGEETCDGSDCYFECNDGLVCTQDIVAGSPDTCNVGCLFEPIETATDGDACCPEGANANTDGDCEPVCANGAQESGEACDDENHVDGDGCSADCSSDETCANGVIDEAAGEVCDDRNHIEGDGCSADCRSGEVCGNSIIDGAAGEVCDDGGQEGGDGCSANCMSDETCGNGITDTLAGEVCDDDNTTGGDGCNATCTARVEAVHVTLGFGNTCAVLSNGRGYCWGNNDNSMLGVGNVGDPAWTPRQVLTNRTDWVEIYGGADGDRAQHCGLTTGNLLLCWGANDFGGKVGDGATSTVVTSPYQHSSTWLSVAANREYTVGVRADTTLCRWGTNFGTTPACTTTGWKSAAGFYDHACLLHSDGGLWCAGSNNDGQLGTSDTIGYSTPKRVQTATDWLAVTGGGAHTCGIRGSNGQGSLWCWGDNEYGQLGFAGTYTNDGTVSFQDNFTLPQQVGSDATWTAVAAGLDHTCAVKADRSLWCWGRNNRGQLGMGDFTTRTSPTQMPATEWSDVSAGYSFTCAIQLDGSLWCFGANGFGELGPPFDASTSSHSPSPVRVTFP
jgi:cysteine-rich repeat protein